MAVSIPDLILAAARRYGVDPRLAVEVAIKESNLNPNTPPSSAGAIGIMQLMPATARSLGVNPYDLHENIEGGVRLLRQLLNRFGNIAHALGGYNWRPDRVANAVRQWGSAWLEHAPAETQDYVQTILTRLRKWESQATVTGAGLRKAGTVVSEFQSLPQPQQIGLMLLAVALGIVWLMGPYEVD